MALNNEDFRKVGVWLDGLLKSYNYEIAPLAKSGKPGKNIKSMREYRLQLINKHTDTSQKLANDLLMLLKKSVPNIKNLKYNDISPNSSKFPSCTFTYDGQDFDLIISRGANKGENFETKTVADLSAVFVNKKITKGAKPDAQFLKLIEQLNESNKEFSKVEIKSVEQRKGSTKKENVPIEKLGAIIGDIVLKDFSDNSWYISLKDVNGDTFSSYSGAASLFNSSGDLDPKSAGADFLNAFGVDLNKVQEGFDLRNKIKKLRKKIPVQKANPAEIKKIFERAWGMNYFYVRKTSSGWKVFWMSREKLNKLTTNIKVTDIRYPTEKSKQITIYCGNSEQDYVIELRNSKAGEYPNDTKFKVK